MNAIFFDIDGVLNAYGTDLKTRSKSKCGNFLGIDKNKVRRLARIVKETDAILILSSSWKIGWEPHKRYTVEPYDYYDPYSSYHAKYLDNHLKKKGGLVITDKTRERNLEDRGTGIKDYLTQHPEIKNWIVLDDEIFRDFQSQGIMPHLIKINPILGLTETDADAAIKILKGQLSGPYKADPQLFNKTVTAKQAGPAVERK